MPSATTTAPIVAMGAPALTGAPDKKRKIICFSGTYLPDRLV